MRFAPTPQVGRTLKRFEIHSARPGGSPNVAEISRAAEGFITKPLARSREHEHSVDTNAITAHEEMYFIVVRRGFGI